MTEQTATATTAQPDSAHEARARYETSIDALMAKHLPSRYISTVGHDTAGYYTKGYSGVTAALDVTQAYRKAAYENELIARFGVPGRVA